MSKHIEEERTIEDLWDAFEENVRAGFWVTAMAIIERAKHLGYDDLAEKMRIAL